jgi:hypothetical protein
VLEGGLLPGDATIEPATKSQQYHAVARGGDLALVVWSDYADSRRAADPPRRWGREVDDERLRVERVDVLERDAALRRHERGAPRGAAVGRVDHLAVVLGPDVPRIERAELMRPGRRAVATADPADAAVGARELVPPFVVR